MTLLSNGPSEQDPRGLLLEKSSQDHSLVGFYLSHGAFSFLINRTLFKLTLNAHFQFVKVSHESREK